MEKYMASYKILGDKLGETMVLFEEPKQMELWKDNHWFIRNIGNKELYLMNIGEDTHIFTFRELQKFLHNAEQEKNDKIKKVVSNVKIHNWEVAKQYLLQILDDVVYQDLEHYLQKCHEFLQEYTNVRVLFGISCPTYELPKSCPFSAK
jgi:hypothetical protein